MTESWSDQLDLLIPCPCSDPLIRSLEEERIERPCWGLAAARLGTAAPCFSLGISLMGSPGCRIVAEAIRIPLAALDSLKACPGSALPFLLLLDFPRYCDDPAILGAAQSARSACRRQPSPGDHARLECQGSLEDVQITCSDLPLPTGGRSATCSKHGPGQWASPPADALEQLVHSLQPGLTEQRSARCRPGP